MSFGILKQGYLSLSSYEKEALYYVDSNIDFLKYHPSLLRIEFDIENPYDLPRYANKKDITEYLKLYDEDQFEFLNTILWEFLLINPKTREKIELLNEISMLADMPESELDTIVKEKSNFSFKSFKSFKLRMLEDHGIDFYEYQTYRYERLKVANIQPCPESRATLILLSSKYPIIKKISSQIFIEIHPFMSDKHISKHINSINKFKLPKLLKNLPTQNRAIILCDALLLYKYYAGAKMNNKQNISQQRYSASWEGAKRYFNCHILQEFGLSTTLEKTSEIAKIRTKGLMCKIETVEKYELKNDKFLERKRVIKVIESSLKLPNIGT